jgi:hypothetical protein
MNQPLPPPPPPGFQYAQAPAAPAPAPAQAYAPPPAAPAQPQQFAYAAAAPQGFAAPAPQGFNQAPAQPQAPSLNGIAVSDLNLMPQQNLNGTTRFKVTSYLLSNRQSGPAYTVGLQVEASNAADLSGAQPLPAGAKFNVLFKISYDPRKQGGDKSRKKFVAACFGANVNAAIDFDAADAQLRARDFNAQPLTLDLDQRVNYGRPVLDNNTKQPLPGQWWSDSNWRLVSG